MTQRQIKLVENYIRLKVKKVLAEKKVLKEGIFPEEMEALENWFSDIEQLVGSAQGKLMRQNVNIQEFIIIAKKIKAIASNIELLK